MKKWLLLLLCLLLALCAAGCAEQEKSTEGSYLLYVPATGESVAGADAITPLSTDLDVADSAPLEEKAAAAVERILLGGGAKWAGIQLQDVSIKNRRVYVDFSPHYSRLTGIELSLIDYCITLSLAQMEGISSVTITVNGVELPFRDSQVMMEQDVLLSTMDDVIETVRVGLFFENESGELVEETRMLELYEGQTLAESIMAALLEGPQEKELNAVIPEGFTVSKVRVEDRVCILSLSQSALALLPEDEAAQRQILQSIAKTVYFRGMVDELQILVDGEVCNSFGKIPTAEVQFRPTPEQK